MTIKQTLRKHWVIETVRTEVKERPVRLVSFMLFILAVSCFTPYAERHGPDGIVVRYTENTSRSVNVTDRLDACPGNRSIDDGGNVSVAECMIAKQAQTPSWNNLQELRGGQHGWTAPT